MAAEKMEVQKVEVLLPDSATYGDFCVRMFSFCCL